MVEKREILEKYVKEQLQKFSELGKSYDDVKVNALIDNLLASNKSVLELEQLIDSKFSSQLSKMNHNNHLASLKKYYLSNVERLKKGNNCYLLSYEDGIKVLEQAKVVEVKKNNKDQVLVKLNDDSLAYKKGNSVSNDYELIISDIAYLLNVKYAKTYRVFDSKMKEDGILNECFDSDSDRFLNLEEALRFIKEESSKFTLKENLIEYHDRHFKNKNSTLKENIDYVFKLFEALPDITKTNVEELKHDFLTMKVFEVLINSVDNKLDNIGIIVNKRKVKYTYKLSPSYNKYFIKKDGLSSDQTICNFITVTKSELIDYLARDYYDYVKFIMSLISSNKKTLIPLIEQIVKEQLDYDNAVEYIKIINENIDIISNSFELYKMMDSDDEKIFIENKEDYENRVAPFIDNYETINDEKGSASFSMVAAGVLIGTIILIAIAIIVISKATF